MKYILGIAILSLFVGQNFALKCYKCSYDTDKECTGTDVDISAINSEKDPDGDIFEYCTKVAYDNDKRGMRGTADKDDLNSWNIKNGKCDDIDMGDSDGNMTRYDDAIACVCDTDWCNGGKSVTVSIASMLITFIAKYCW